MYSSPKIQQETTKTVLYGRDKLRFLLPLVRFSQNRFWSVPPWRRHIALPSKMSLVFFGLHMHCKPGPDLNSHLTPVGRTRLS
jgi:hypothetical protein